jgi:hypothetical protein
MALPARRTAVPPASDAWLAELRNLLYQADLNLLLIGSTDGLGHALQLIVPYLDVPLETWSPLNHTPVPRLTSGTILVERVEAATRAQQLQLAAKTADAVSTLRIVSTTTTPLFPMVQNGRFLPELYYRLNCILVDLSEVPDNRRRISGTSRPLATPAPIGHPASRS